MSMPSPLDGDFFELLQRLRPKERSRDATAVKFLLDIALENPGEQLWDSMERMFYTLHLRAVMRETLFPKEVVRANNPQKLIGSFARSTQALLRAAHKKQTCGYHSRLFQRLRATDAVITFNYDLVPERALKGLFESEVQFGPWLYGLERRDVSAGQDVPLLYKLHGSVNWQTQPDKQMKVKQKNWKDFELQPGYTGDAFSILLPFWDKKVEDPPWREIWRKAALQLRGTTSLIIWGYSLPVTDLKARELFKIGLGSEGTLRNLCVIDPSAETRRRWRNMFVRQQFRQYENIDEFLHALAREASGLRFSPLIPDAE